ncbi:MAG: hypothetical protein IIZ74_09265 [Erysipelotrichaceae bacterium]|nr:hypothetical protein [Erysipelotrichaceae bacterium]
MNLPVNYEFINLYNSRMSPSTVHCKNTALVNYYTKYLFEKVISIYKWEGIPDSWAVNYFLYTLFGKGFLAVFDTEEYGVIPNECALAGYNVFYQPTTALVANPALRENRRMLIGEECELIRMQPNYSGVMDIVSNYADLMALAMETAGINLLNSKLSYVFFSDNQANAASFKKLYDQIASGEPMAVIDKDLIGIEGEKHWELFTQNVGQNYITDRVLTDMRTLENMFNTEIGIPNANTMKRERLISDEVNSNNVDTQSKVILWLETMQNDIKKVNDMFNLNISVKYRYEDKEVEADAVETNNVDNGAL